MSEKSPSILSATAWISAEKAMLMSDVHLRALLNRMAEAVKQGDLPEDIKSAAAATNRSVTQIATATPSQGVIACIPMVGVLNKAYDWCGMVSTTRLLEQLSQAVADPAVSAIVLDIDSPGGFVNGSVEFADAVAEANAIKPVTAVVRGLCCSGAYWIASQCGQIVSRPESETGNIGVYTVLADFSEFYKSLGINLTTVSTGQFKGLGADGRVTDDLISDSRRIVQGLYQQFVAAVSNGRNIALQEATDLADGRAYLGPQAKKLGLIDSIASSFAAAIQIASDKETNTQESNDMASKSAATAPSTPHPALAAAVQSVVTPPAAQQPGTSPTAAAAAKSGGGPSNEDVRKTLGETIKSANDHKSQVRAALDQAGDMSDDPDDETKSLAKRAAAAMKATSDEAGRCSKAWLTKAGGDETDDDDDDDEDEPKNGDDKDKSKETAAHYIAAFGDQGARWFVEKKPFAQAASEYIQQLKAAHKTETDSLKAQNAELQKKLGAVERGNEPAAASIAQDAKSQQAAKGHNGLSKNLSRYAEGLKFAGTVTTVK